MRIQKVNSMRFIRHTGGLPTHWIGGAPPTTISYNLIQEECKWLCIFIAENILYTSLSLQQIDTCIHADSSCKVWICCKDISAKWGGLWFLILHLRNLLIRILTAFCPFHAHIYFFIFVHLDCSLVKTAENMEGLSCDNIRRLTCWGIYCLKHEPYCCEF